MDVILILGSSPMAKSPRSSFTPHDGERIDRPINAPSGVSVLKHAIFGELFLHIFQRLLPKRFSLDHQSFSHLRQWFTALSSRPRFQKV